MNEPAEEDASLGEALSPPGARRRKKASAASLDFLCVDRELDWIIDLAIVLLEKMRPKPFDTLAPPPSTALASVSRSCMWK
mmetsp:Transcript_19448/g.55743  ORF Transcript_19448/g.55743 Transcript_19448/m.55743 type:complete len:81 (+) Transcript_19448:389-631(+)